MNIRAAETNPELLKVDELNRMVTLDLTRGELMLLFHRTEMLDKRFIRTYRAQGEVACAHYKVLRKNFDVDIDQLREKIRIELYASGGIVKVSDRLKKRGEECEDTYSDGSQVQLP